MDKIPVIAVVGPTASGKTALAVEIAKAYNGEVISADSMQIYTGMSVATAKPTPEEMCGIKHRLIDFVSPEEEYSVARYCEDAKKAIGETVNAGKLPVICGGTGLYTDSLLGNMSFEEETGTSGIREKLMKRCGEEGIETLFDELTDIDPGYASTLHINNKVRIIRALEIYLSTGEKPSVVRARAKNKESEYLPLYIGLDYKDRQRLYDRINRRVDIMMENGLEAEARMYYESAGKTAVQAIGYKELAPYFEGKCTLAEAVDSLKKATRHYAKRQLTWFRRNTSVNWLFPDETGFDGVIAEAESLTGSFLGSYGEKKESI